MKAFGLIITATFLLLVSQLSAQSGSNLREKKVAFTGDTIRLDTLSLVPGSVQLTVGSNVMDTNDVTIDHIRSLIILKKGVLKPTDSIQISYRVFPLDFTKPYNHKDPSAIEPDASGQQNPFSYTYKPKEEGILNLRGLDKRGSISRGVNFGNNQNLSVNSTLNLQLSGQVNDKVSILAAISDDNIPIQPEGNTQQLQEFDRVYIQLYNDRSRLTAGDFQLTRPENSYFLFYNKRAQGGSFETRFSLSRSDTTKQKMGVRASAAVSRGKFARNIVQGVEGNQGPYRLRGSEGENFIIVISGTERIYIDGKLLTRGQDNDYIIDYNTAELIFTAKQLITKDKRIVAEFQYSDKNYARSLIEFSDEYQSERLQLFFNVYSEQDSRNQPLQQDLTEQQRQVLRDVGDSLDQAIAPSIDSIAFDADRIQYRILDTTVVDELTGDTILYDSVFVFSNDPDDAFYVLTFSNVGSGNGNYVLDRNTANGKVYRWVPPINGIPQGAFEPIILLVTPKQRQMVTLGGSYKVSKTTDALFEVALSNQDVNTFSDKDSKDDVDVALRTGLENRQQLNKKNEKPWMLTSGLSYEYIGQNFNQIERFRSVEFDRDWNIRDIPLTKEQHIAGASLAFTNEQILRVKYSFDTYISGNEYDAYKNALHTTIQQRGFDIDHRASYIVSGGNFRNTDFLRQKTLAKKSFSFLTIGFRDDYERNKFTDVLGDTLQANSYEFWEWELFVTNNDTAANRYKLNYIQRRDYATAADRLRQATFGESVGFSFDLLKNVRSRLSGLVSYRQLEINNRELTLQEPENTLLSRLEYSLKMLKGSITSTSFFEVGSGLEARKEFTFIEVQPGQGTYVWNDYNANRVPELDEFEIAVSQDTARYIKVFTPTDDYVKVFTNQFNQAFFFRPAAVWTTKKGIKRVLARFSDQIAYRIDRKTNNEEGLDRYNPFTQQITDSSLLALNSSFRNTFYFNRTDPKFGADINYQQINGKTLLTNGFESRGNKFWEAKARWNLTRVFTLNGEYTDGRKTNQSDFFTSRNYTIDYFSVKPGAAYQPNAKMRVSLFFDYEEKMNGRDTANTEQGGETTINRTVGTEFKFNSVGKGSFLLNFNFIDIRYNGEVNNAIAFEMLDGLLPGENGTWSVSYLRTLANNLQLNLNYSGRKSQGAKIIHTGGVQVRAFF